MIVKSGEPLSTKEVFNLTGEDACAVIGKYNCRIMNFSANQDIEVVDTVPFKGYTFGIKEMKKPEKRYQYLAFIIKE